MPIRLIAKPWGHEEIFAETPSYVGKILVINPGHRLSRQYHQVKEETFRVLRGNLSLEIGQGSDMVVSLLGPGDCYHCPTGTIHRLACDIEEEEAVQVVEVSTNHLEDIVRIEDDYNR